MRCLFRRCERQPWDILELLKNVDVNFSGLLFDNKVVNKMKAPLGPQLDLRFTVLQMSQGVF